MDTVSIDNLHTYLDNKAANSINTLYSITVTGVTNVNQEDIYFALADNNNKYVSLFIQGSISRINSDWLIGIETIYQLELPNTVTRIEDNSFYNCYNLSYIKCSKVSYIGENAFLNCVKLISITCEATSLGEQAFCNCFNLQLVDFENTLTSIGRNAFDRCYSLVNIWVNANSFSNLNLILGLLPNNGNLYNVLIANPTDAISYGTEGSSISPLGNLLATNSSKDLSIKLSGGGSNLRIVYNNQAVFSNLIILDVGECYNYDSIFDSVKFPNLSELYIRRGSYKTKKRTNPAYYVDVLLSPTVIYSSDEKSIHFCPPKAEGHLVIENTVETIDTNAFKNCSLIEDIFIPQSVNFVGTDAFSGISSTGRVIYQQSTRDTYNIDNWASITFANKYANPISSGRSFVTGYGDDPNISYYNLCENQIEFTNNLTEIKSNTFVTKRFEGFTIPNSVTTFGNNAFIDSSVVKVNYAGTLSQWTQINFSNKNSNPFCGNINTKLYTNESTSNHITTFDTGDSLTQIKDNVFYNYKYLTSLRLGTAITFVGQNSFNKCTGITSITIDSSNLSNLQERFVELTGLRYVYGIPLSVTNMMYCFEDCSNLLEIHGFKVDIENCNLYGCFSGCSNLRGIYIDFPQVVSSDTTWHVVSVDYSEANEITIKSYKTELNNSQLDLERTKVIQFTDAPELGIYNTVEEIAAATDITDAEIKNLVKYKYPFGKTREGLDPSQKSFVLWAANQDTVISNIISLKDTDYADIL